MAILEIAVVDMSGDTKITWDPDRPVEVENARRTYDSLRGQGYTPHLLAGKRGNKIGERITEFDPHAEGLVMVPALTAG